MQGLFGGGGPKPCDREELFGEAAGKIGSNVAKHIPGKNMAMDQLQGGIQCRLVLCGVRGVESVLPFRERWALLFVQSMRVRHDPFLPLESTRRRHWTTDPIQAKGVSSTSEVSKAHAAFLERGNKISELEDRTEAMANEAKNYASNSHKLMLEAKNKKWYQL